MCSTVRPLSSHVKMHTFCCQALKFPHKNTCLLLPRYATEGWNHVNNNKSCSPKEPLQTPKSQKTCILMVMCRKHRTLPDFSPPRRLGPTPGKGPKGTTRQREPWAPCPSREELLRAHTGATGPLFAFHWGQRDGNH